MSYFSEQYLFVANSASNAITAYGLQAGGNAPPAFTIAGPTTQLHHPIGVAKDATGALYVLNQGGDPSVTVYAPGQHGNVAPIRVIKGNATKITRTCNAIAVAASGAVYVACRFEQIFAEPPGGYILGFAPNANGNVAPTWEKDGANWQTPWTGSEWYMALAIACDGDVLSLVGRKGQNGPPVGSVSRFTADLSQPGIGGSGFALQGALYAGQSAMAISRESGAVGITDDTRHAVDEYSVDAAGNAALLRDITGANSQLAQPVGLAVDPSETLYALDQTGAGQSVVLVYGPNANGNTAPTRALSGPNTQLHQAAGLAIGPA
jgi:hypothetical protein